MGRVVHLVDSPPPSGPHGDAAAALDQATRLGQLGWGPPSSRSRSSRAHGPDLPGRLTEGSRTTRVRSIEEEVHDLVGLYEELMTERRSGSG